MLGDRRRIARVRGNVLHGKADDIDPATALWTLGRSLASTEENRSSPKRISRVSSFHERNSSPAGSISRDIIC